MFCPKCEKEVARTGSKFCPHCGGVLAAPVLVTCPKCGSASKQNSKFCRKCGFCLGEIMNIEHPEVQDETREIHAGDFKPEAGADETREMFASEFKPESGTDETVMAQTMMSCPGCGAPMQAGHKFCIVCGHKTAGSGDSFAAPGLEQYSGAKEDTVRNAKNAAPGQPSRLFSARNILWGTLILFIVAAAGAAVYAFLQGYILDRESPEAAIVYPAGGKTITLNTSGGAAKDIIEIKAEDNRRLKKVDLFVNAVPVQSFDNFGSMIYNWETDQEGDYTFYAMAQDYSGNIGKSAPLVIQVKKPVSSPAGMSTNYPMEKQAVELFVNNWIKTITDRRFNEHMACYAETLDVYYTKNSVSKSEISNNRQEMFNTFSRIDMSIYNLQVSMGSNNSATATFNKKWDCSGAETFSGEVVQRLNLKNINGRWLITSEEEIQILWAVRNGNKIE